MRRVNRWMLAILVLALPLGACAGGTAEAAVDQPAVTVEEIDGTELSRLTLSDKAAERLGIETAPVAEAEAAGNLTTIPYSAVMYDAAGHVWAYTNPDGRAFVRAEISVDRIEGGLAYLAAGPAVGTLVVTVGAAELWGVETGVGGGH